MSQGVHSYLLLDTCFFRYFPDHPLHTAWGKTFMPVLSIEEPFDGLFGFEVFFQTTAQEHTNGYITVFPSFALADVDHVTIEVHVFDEQVP
jgi:hypothetical protein